MRLKFGVGHHMENDRLQLNKLFEQFDLLHQKHGSQKVAPIYGAGQINNPKLCLIFMNPTARNVSADLSWQGLRAPWIGTKNIWKMLDSLNLLNDSLIVNEIVKMKPLDWTPRFATELYEMLAKSSIYITNIAKCTQDDARPLSDTMFREYLPTIYEEIETINPEHTITFGNQVSSVLLKKRVSVSDYKGAEHEIVLAGSKEFKVYPTFYPVGQGMRNMPKAIERINEIVNS